MRPALDISSPYLHPNDLSIYPIPDESYDEAIKRGAQRLAHELSSVRSYESCQSECNNGLFPEPSSALSESPVKSKSPDPFPWVYCTWEGGCGARLDDVSPGGLTRHLQQWHITGRWEQQQAGRCKWSNGKGYDPCDRPMSQGSYGKHIASTHLRLTASMCKKCHGILSRLDVTTGHANPHKSCKRPHSIRSRG
ncbi:hypothetical protein BKA93DRAFT_345798 [Sparassis latifolia]